jgi:hypothetical protein
MRKSLTVAVAALTFGGAVAATAAPAQARPHGGYYGGGYNGGYYGHRHHGGNDAAIVAGVAGLAIGAALASGSHNRGYYNGGYYNSGYYGRSYAYDPYYGDRYYYSRPRYVYRTCESERWVWDPYIQDRVLVRSRYRC